MNENDDYTTNVAQLAVVAANVSKGSIRSDSLPAAAQVTQELDEELVDSSNDLYVVENAHTELYYEDVLPNISLNYATIGSSLKEDIIVSETDEQYVYTFKLTLKNLIPVAEENGVIYLNDSVSEECVYYIPAAFMIDANGDYSENVETSINEVGNDQYILTITADAQWMNDSERAFPVTIDPTLEKSTADSEDFELRDVYVVEGDSSTYYPYGNMLGYVGHGSVSTAQTHRFFAEFRKLPELPAGSVITGASLYYYQYKYDPYSTTRTTSFALDAKEVTSNLDWDSGVTWDTQPTYSDIVLDSKTMSDDTTGTYVGWNITSLIKKKYEAGNDDEYAAIALVADDEQSISSTLYSAVVTLCKATRTTNKPYIVINYRDSYGVEDYYSCQTQDIGAAGTVYIGDYTSQLTLEKNDYSNNSEAISFSLEHYYNSGLSAGYFGYVSTYTKDFTSMKFGKGWKLNAQQTVIETKLGSTTYYIYTDGDGTEHYFTADPDDKSTFVDEDNLGLSIKKSGSNFTMTDGITTTVFYNGYLTSMTDSFGNAVYFVYNGKSYSASSTTWKPAASGNQLTSIVQVNAADNKAQTLVTLTYGSNNYLTKITDKAGNITEYTYTSSKLTKVTHADSSTVSYTYSGNYLTSATDNTSGYGVAYTWETLGFRKIVNDIKEYTNSNGSKTYGAEIKVDGSDLQHTVYTYNGSDRTFDTSDDQISTYTFDYAGRTVNVCTKNPNGTILGVETGSYGNKSATNSLTSSASLGQQAANDVLNGGAEVTDSGSTLDISGWNIGTVSNGSVKANTTESHHGDRSFALANTKNSSASAQAYASRTLRTDTFTLSAYIKTTDITSFGTNGGASIQFCTDEAGTNVVAESELVNYKTSSTTDNGWVRVSCTYTPTVKQKYYFFLRLKNVTVKPPHEKHRRPTLL